MIIKFRSWNHREKVMEYPDNIANGIDSKKYGIMQYTGLKDKNGKEIYEGDIIKNENYKWSHKVIYTLGSFKGKQTRGKFRGYADGMFFDRFEVIGNIYEEEI